ncbi:hypothetical protein AGMMS4957_02640 [Bacteroidia bacterium]|nr:hypothetical protein AGMMS4957_02640 [Bacteroidia bacterium]
MQTQEIINLITQRQPLTDKTLSELQILTEKYPYFSVAQVLFTLNLKSRDDSRLDASMLKAACYIGDRRQLFYLMEELPTVGETSEFTSSDYAPAQPEYTPEPDSHTVTKPDTEESAPVVAPAPVVPAPEVAPAPPVAPAPVTPAPPINQAAMIDSFLLQQPGNQPTELVYAAVADDYAENFLMDAEDAEDVEDDGQKDIPAEFFSVTLVEIYIKQKKYEQALRMLRKLNLENPEKSRYFADQIRFLEKLINNTKK